MNVYKFYLRRKHMPKIFENERGKPDDFVLYAHTGNPELAKNFQKFRNMNRFRCVKTKMKSSKYKAYASHAQEQTLTKQEYIYFKDAKTDKHEFAYMHLVLTYRESETLQFIMDSGVVKEFDFFCPGIFKDCYYDALRDIKYVDAFKMWITEMDSNALHALNTILECRGEHDHEFSPMDIDYDEVEVFMSLFDSTL